jgi:hypothetical protein
MREALLRVILLSLPPAFPFGSLALARSQSLGSTMDMFIFPAQGQDSSQQSKDEAACYEWAVGNAGVDPFSLAKQEEANQQQAQAAAQAEQREEAAEQQLVNFTNAFSVCLEAKEYRVKY